MKGDGRGRIAEALHSFLDTIVGSKNKTIHLRDFKDVDLNFTYFANFKFGYFEIELNFRFIWLNLRNGRYHLPIFHFGYLKGARFKYRPYFCSFCV